MPYMEDITPSLCHLVMRSAWKLGKPDQCNETHAVELFLNYDPTPASVRKRFSLQRAQTRPFATIAAEVSEEARSGFLDNFPTKDNVDAKMMEATTQAYLGAFVLHCTHVESCDYFPKRTSLYI